MPSPMPDPPNRPTELAAHRPAGGRSGARLYGVMVTYRRPTELGSHLSCPGRQTGRLDHVVVIDNDADDRTGAVASLVAEHDDGSGSLTYCRSEANLGPAGGIARGMEWAVERADDDDWIVLLDDDDPPASDDLLERLATLAGDVASEVSGGRVGGIGVIGAPFDRRSGRLRRLADDELQGHV